MALEFRPPTDLIEAYNNRPNPGLQVIDAANQALQHYAQAKALKQKQQNDALDSYISAFKAGGSQLATEVGKRNGLVNPPPLANQNMQPQVGIGNPTPLSTPAQSSPPPYQSPLPTPTEDAAQQSLPTEHPTAPSQISPVVKASLDVGHPNHSGIQLPATENPNEFLNQGEYGQKQLAARESLAKYGDAKAKADATAEENGPKSFVYAQAFAKNAGVPSAADDFIKIAQNEGRNSLTKREMSDLKDSINVSAQQGRGQYFGTQAELNKAKFDNELLQQANKNINPNAASGSLKPQQERLNRIGRANALVDQMNTQKGGGDTRQMRELATSLASVLTGGNVIAENQISELVPQTYKGNVNKFLEKLSNNPTGLEQQAFISRLADTLNREKSTIHTQINTAQNQALPAMQILKQRNPKAYQELINANVNNPNYQNQPLGNGSVTIRDSQGGLHTLPHANLEAAKQRDPGLQVVQ